MPWLRQKPLEGAGAASTFRADTTEALAHALKESPPSESNPVLLEEFVLGTEHSFDAYTRGSDVMWHSVSHYYPTPLEVMRTPWIQWRVVVPREVDDPLYNDIREVAAQALTALGMPTGMCHMEWFRRRDGSIAISEVGARPPGAQFTTLLSRANDFDAVRAWINLLVFDTFEPPTRQYAAGAAYLRGQGAGRVREVHGLHQVYEQVGHLITDARPPEPGQAASSSYEGNGYIIVRHPDTAVVDARLRYIVSVGQKTRWNRQRHRLADQRRRPRTTRRTAVVLGPSPFVPSAMYPAARADQQRLDLLRRCHHHVAELAEGQGGQDHPVAQPRARSRRPASRGGRLPPARVARAQAVHHLHPQRRRREAMRSLCLPADALRAERSLPRRASRLPAVAASQRWGCVEDAPRVALMQKSTSTLHHRKRRIYACPQPRPAQPSKR
ncbi:MAG: hypothetical protein KIS91_03015 [Anaerolineae bacterium]|nr:hypothetical protein [Anaerolineae bacterium]